MEPVSAISPLLRSGRTHELVRCKGHVAGVGLSGAGTSTIRKEAGSDHSGLTIISQALHDGVLRLLKRGQFMRGEVGVQLRAHELELGGGDDCLQWPRAGHFRGVAECARVRGPAVELLSHLAHNHGGRALTIDRAAPGRRSRY